MRDKRLPKPRQFPLRSQQYDYSLESAPAQSKWSYDILVSEKFPDSFRKNEIYLVESAKDLSYCVCDDKGKIKKGKITADEWQEFSGKSLSLPPTNNKHDLKKWVKQYSAITQSILAAKGHVSKLGLKKGKIYVEKEDESTLRYCLVGHNGKEYTGRLSWYGKSEELALLLTENIQKLKPLIIDIALKNGHIFISLEQFTSEVSKQLKQFLDRYEENSKNAAARKAAQAILPVVDGVKVFGDLKKLLSGEIKFDKDSIGILINHYWIRIPKITFEPADLEFFLLYQNMLEMARQISMPRGSSLIFRFIGDPLEVINYTLWSISEIVEYQPGSRQGTPGAKTLCQFTFFPGEIKSFNISRGYALCLMTDQKELKPGNIYIRNTESGELEYTILAENSERFNGTITNKDLECAIPNPVNDKDLKCEIPNPVTEENLQSLSKRILNITLSRGHTYPDDVHQDLGRTQYERVIAEMEMTSLRLIKSFHNSLAEEVKASKASEVRVESIEHRKEDKESGPELKECKEHEVSQPIYEVRDNKHTPQEDSQDIHESNKKRESGKESVVNSISEIKTAEWVDVAEQIKSLQAEQKNSEREILELLDSKEKYKLNRGEQRAKKANIDYEIKVVSRSLSRTEATKRSYNNQIQQLGLWGKTVEYFRRYIGDRLGSPSSLFSKIKDCDEVLRRNQEILREQDIRLQNVNINLKDLEGIILNKEKEISDAIAKQNEKKEDLIGLIKKYNENVFKAIINEVKDWKQLDETSQKNIKALVEKALQGADCQRPIHQSVISKISEKITAALYDKWSHIEEDEQQQRKGVYIEGTKHIMARFFGSFSRGETLTCQGLKEAINTIKSQQSPAPAIAIVPSGNR